jgi:anti-anti-sigma factor
VTLLEVDTDERDGVVRVMLRGELDLSTAGQLEEALTQAEARRPAAIAIDLSALRFLDSTGLRVVVMGDERARREGRRLALVRGPEAVQRVFSITGLDTRLEMVDDVAELR